jgi:RNA polymerase subunit RPABC4/transcription elongation factor Spt4
MGKVDFILGLRMKCLIFFVLLALVGCDRKPEASGTPRPPPQPTIGRPAVQFSAQAQKAYDTDALGNQLGSTLADAFNGSGKYVVTEDPHPQFTCKVLVNDFEIQQQQSQTASGLSKISSFFKSLKPGGSMSLLTNVNLSESDLSLSVKCSVRLELYNEESRTMVSSATGTVTENGRTQTVALNVAGTDLFKQNLAGSSAQRLPPTNSFDLQTRVLDLAASRAYDALTPGGGHQAGEGTVSAHSTQAAAGGALVCPYCFKPISATDKFCPSCGKPILHFCPHCGKPVEVGAKFCPNCGRSLTSS